MLLTHLFTIFYVLYRSNMWSCCRPPVSWSRMLQGPYGSLDRDRPLIRLPFTSFAVGTVLLPLTGLVACLFISLVYHFEDSTYTHCQVGGHTVQHTRTHTAGVFMFHRRHHTSRWTTTPREGPADQITWSQTRLSCVHDKHKYKVLTVCLLLWISKDHHLIGFTSDTSFIFEIRL